MPLVSQQHSESIPDILQTLSQGVVREGAVQQQARVIVNELSGIEEKLVDLSPSNGQEAQSQMPTSSYISVKHSNIDDNI